MSEAKVYGLLAPGEMTAVAPRRPSVLPMLPLPRRELVIHEITTLADSICTRLESLIELYDDVPNGEVKG